MFVDNKNIAIKPVDNVSFVVIMDVTGMSERRLLKIS